MGLRNDHEKLNQENVNRPLDTKNFKHRRERESRYFIEKYALAAVTLTPIQTSLFLLMLGTRVSARRGAPRVAGNVVLPLARRRLCSRLPRSGTNCREMAKTLILGRTSLTSVNECKVRRAQTSTARIFRAEARPRDPNANVKHPRSNHSRARKS